MTAAAAFGAFAEDSYARLVGTLVLYCGEVEIAEELAHDTLVRAQERWDDVSQMDAPGAWLHRVAVNLANSYFRRRLAERRAVNRASIQRVGRHVPDPDAALLVRRAVAGLPPRQREAVILRHFHDLPVVGAAETMGITAGSMKQLTHRALTSLRQDPGVGSMLTQEAHGGV